MSQTRATSNETYPRTRQTARLLRHVVALARCAGAMGTMRLPKPRAPPSPCPPGRPDQELAEVAAATASARAKSSPL